MRPIFATDVDSVLIDISHPLERAVKAVTGVDISGFMTGAHPLTIGMWDLRMAFGVDKETMDKIWDEAFSQPCFPYIAAPFFIKTLRRDFTVVGVSNREGPRFIPPAIRDTAPLGLDALIFTKHSDGKGKTIKNLGDVRFMVDDKIGNLLDVHEVCPEVGLFLMDQPWNVSCDINVPYKRVFSLDGVLEAINV